MRRKGRGGRPWTSDWGTTVVRTLQRHPRTLAAFISGVMVVAGVVVMSPPAAQAATVLPPPPVCPTTPISVGIESVLTAEAGVISYQYWPGGTVTLGSGGCTVSLQRPNGNIATAIGGNDGWRITGWAGFATAVIGSYGPVNTGSTGIPNCNSPAAAGSLVDGNGGKRPVCSSSVGTSASVATITITVTTNTVPTACTDNQMTVTTVSRESSGAQIWNGSNQTKGNTDCYVVLQEPDARIDSIPGRGWKVVGFKGYGSATITEYGPVNSGPNGTPNCGSPAAFGYYTNDPDNNKRPVCSSALGSVTSSSSVTVVLTPRPTLTVLASIGGGSGTVTSVPAGVNCGAGGTDCVVPFETGTTVTLSALAAADSKFDGWTGAGCSGTGSCVVTMSASKSVTPSFSKLQRLLTVNIGGLGGGSVTSSPAGINCSGGTCVGIFDLGASITLTAAPEAGSAFAGWTGAGCDGVQTICNLVLLGDTTVDAVFQTANVGQFQISVTKSGTGSGTVTSDPAGISCGPTCATSFSSGTSVGLTATPATGSVFGGWVGGGCSGTLPQCSVAATSDQTVFAIFNPAPTRTLTVSRGGTGTGTVTSSPSGINCGATCSKAFVQGTLVTLTAAPDSDAKFSGWSGGACSGTGTCKVTVSTSLTVTATFASLSSVVVVPGAPTKVVGGPRIKAVRVTWAAPPNGGSPITKYKVTASPGGRTCTTSTKTCVVTGLVNGTAYKFTVKATNVVGTGKASAASAAVKAGSPTKPQALSVTFPAAGVARVAWKAPALVNAGPVLSYQVRKSANNGSTWGVWVTVKVSALRLTSMRKGTTYLVQVRAVNKAGAGPAAQLKFIQKT